MKNAPSFYAGVALVATLLAAPTYAQDHAHHHGHGDISTENTSHNHSADAAPISVMGTHTHNKGELMLGYRLMGMSMHGNRQGANRVDIADVHDEYMVAPLQMTTYMHMFSAMYGLTDKLTIMGMVPYLQKDMDHVTRTGVNFTTKTKGVGDVKLSGLYRAAKEWIVGLGVSLPTGSIDKRGNTPAANDAKLPYAMQLGSGTFDVMPSVTWQKSLQQLYVGAQAKATLRTGRNDNSYRLGHAYEATTWVGKQWNNDVSTTLRLSGHKWTDIKGADPELNAGMVPTANTSARAGQRVDVGAGVSLTPTSLPGHTIGLDVTLPVYQKLDSNQLEHDAMLTFGWTKRF